MKNNFPSFTSALFYTLKGTSKNVAVTTFKHVFSLRLSKEGDGKRLDDMKFYSLVLFIIYQNFNELLL